MSKDEFNFDVDEAPAGAGPTVLEPEVLEETALPPVVTYDTRAPLVKLLEFEKEVQDLVAQAKAITTIQTAEADKNAITVAATMKKVFNRLEEVRHHFVDPHWDYKKAVDNFFKKYTDPLKAGFEGLGRKSGAFRLFLDQARRKAQAEAQAEAERLQEKMNKEAQAAAEAGAPFEPVTVLVPVVAEVPRVTRTEEGSASGVHGWDFEITDPTLLPREFLMENEKAIRQAVKGGRREIPGCRIFEKMDTRIRV